MSEYINIFIDFSDKPLVIAAILESELEVKLRPVADSEYLYYRYYDNEKWFTVGRHSLINDKDLNFEDYQYQIQVGVSQSPFLADKVGLKIRNDYARLIFDKLRSLNRYALLMTREFDLKLDEFIPDSS